MSYAEHDFYLTAVQLKERKVERSTSPNYPEIGGYFVTWPGHWVETAPYDAVLPPGAYDAYEIGRQVMSLENMPADWVQLIQEVGQHRERAGSEGPINLITAVDRLSCLHPKAKDLGLEPFGKNREEEMSISRVSEDCEPEMKEMKGRIQTALGNPSLRKSLVEILTYLASDESNGPINKTPILRLVETLKLQGGIFLDCGCGTGFQTLEWEKQLDMTVIGLDRQLYPLVYDASRKKENQACFIQADMARRTELRMGELDRLKGGIPLPDGVVDLAVMEYVVPHIKTGSLSQSLAEITRTLKPYTGTLAITPNTEDYNELRQENQGWAYFIKIPRQVRGEQRWQLSERSCDHFISHPEWKRMVYKAEEKGFVEEQEAKVIRSVESLTPSARKDLARLLKRHQELHPETE